MCNSVTFDDKRQTKTSSSFPTNVIDSMDSAEDEVGETEEKRKNTDTEGRKLKEMERGERETEERRESR